MQTGGYAAACPKLTASEKALIYHYTATGSTQINRLLHSLSQTEQPSALTQGLVAAVRKLPFYEGSAYSAAHFNPAEFNRLRAAAATGDTLVATGGIEWPAFLSASRSMRIAKRHLNYTVPPAPHNCLFLINSLRGRAIDLLSRYGPNGPDPMDNEQEILFLPRTTFRIVGVDFETAYPQIELLEL